MQLADIAPLLAASELKLYYKFSEIAGTTVADSSAGGHGGTASASSILNNPIGPFGYKGVFVSASSDKITITDYSDLKPTGNFSVGGWFRTLTKSNNMIIASYSENTNVAGFFVSIDSSGQIVIRSGKNTGSGAGDFEVARGNTDTADGKWHHFTCVWNGTQLITYVDGVAQATTSWANAPAYAATNYVRVGCYNVTGTDLLFWNGDLDDIFLFNGTALSKVQVNALYTKGIAPKFSDVITDSNLKLYLKLDDNGGTTVTDSSGNSNNGTASASSINNGGQLGMIDSHGVFVSASSNKVTISDAASLKPTGAFSVGGWIYTDTAAKYIFQSESINTNVAGFELTINGSGYAQFTSGKNSGTTLNTDYKVAAGATDLRDGKWHHLVGVYTGSLLILYVDGVVVSSVSWANAPAYAATNYVRVGCGNGTGTDGSFFNGGIDELFLLNGTALSQAQISTLYNSKQGNELNELGLLTDGSIKGYYRFKSGAIVTDEKGSYNLTDHNTVAGEQYGKFGYAANFGDANTNKYLSRSDTLGLTWQGAKSFGGWFRMNAEIASSLWYLMDFTTTNTSGDTSLYYNYNSGSRKLTFGRYKQAGGDHTDQIDYPVTLGASAWHHIVCTYDGTNMKLYFDGALVGTTASTANASIGTGVYTDAFGLGASSGGTTPASMMADDVFVFNRALTDDEVFSMYRLSTLTVAITLAALFFAQP